jgi:hypothetical protein
MSDIKVKIGLSAATAGSFAASNSMIFSYDNAVPTFI